MMLKMVWTLAGKTHVVLAYLLCTTQQEPAIIEPLQPPRVTAVSDMLPSKEFEQYGRMFIQDLHLFGNSMEEIINCIIENYDELKKDELRNFVESILGSNLTHEDLQRLWSAPDSDMETWLTFRSAMWAGTAIVRAMCQIKESVFRISRHNSSPDPR